MKNGDGLRPWDDLFTTLNALNCGAAIVDRAGRLLFVNDKLCAMAQRGRGEIVEKNIADLHDGEDAQKRLHEMQEHFDEARQVESYLVLPDGKHLPVIAGAAPLKCDSMEADFRLITMLDISAQKEIEADLRRQYQIIAELSNTVIDQAMTLKDQSKELERRVAQRTSELHEANVDAIYMLAIASEAKDQDTGKHLRRIRNLAERLAKEIGMDEAQVASIGYASILHDVGKMHVPDRILQKPGPLTDDERVTMQTHTITGARIIADKPFFAMARRVARSHHENWDGSGYPDRLAGKQIPLEARIVHLADVYDALTNQRCYKPAWSSEQAAEEIRKGRGKLFEPELVDAFAPVYLAVTD